jgi:hypothetical protein
MEPWNINETRQHIARLFGRDQLLVAKDSLRSIDDRMTYAAIHYQDAANLIDAYVNEHLKTLRCLKFCISTMRISRLTSISSFVKLERILLHVSKAFIRYQTY